ncbi:MAG TPA: hypothetical protein HA224_02850 [Nanoarchaeota archaeon]|nr:hypothetical protein [Nanoarchaeota archaeon]
MRNKKAVIDMLVEFVIAVVILLVVWLVINVALALHVGVDQGTVKARLESPDQSFACNYWLMNFLRAENEDGIVYSDILSWAKNDGTMKTRFVTDATAYFENNYRRGYNLLRWQLSAETSASQPVLSVGYSDKKLPRQCSQKIVVKGEPPIKVTLGVDY